MPAGSHRNQRQDGRTWQKKKKKKTGQQRPVSPVFTIPSPTQNVKHSTQEKEVEEIPAGGLLKVDLDSALLASHRSPAPVPQGAAAVAPAP